MTSGSSFSLPLPDTLLLSLVGTSKSFSTNNAEKFHLLRDLTYIGVISAGDNSSTGAEVSDSSLLLVDGVVGITTVDGVVGITTVDGVVGITTVDGVVGITTVDGVVDNGEVCITTVGDVVGIATVGDGVDGTKTVGNGVVGSPMLPGGVLGISLVAEKVVGTSTLADGAIGTSTIPDGIFASFELIRCFAKPVAANTEILLWMVFNCERTSLYLRSC